MVVAFKNFEYSFNNDKGKPVFVPSDRGQKIGMEVRRLVSHEVKFEPYYYHFSKGAHVAALHAHRSHQFFARLDLKNFFYSIGRNRVKAALKDIGVQRPEHYSKWSTVRNPYEEPRYSLPYGFAQSPLLATLVLRFSALGQAIHNLPNGVLRSIYLDDIAISSDNYNDLAVAFGNLVEAAEVANFTLNTAKVSPPSERIDLFNCILERGRTEVAGERIALFYDKGGSAERIAAFERYRDSVTLGNN